MKSKPEATAVRPLAAKDPTVGDLSAQIAKRAYELYEEGRRKDDAAVKDWEKAESEICEELAEAGTAPEGQPTSVGKFATKPEATAFGVRGRA